MSKFKLIALDLDGTLTNDEKKITEKTRAALIEAQKKGAIIVLASGRPTSGLLREAKFLEMEKYHGLLLAFNGAKVTDYTTNEVIFEQAIPEKDTHEVLKHLKKFDIDVMIDEGENMLIEDINGYKAEYESSNNNLILKQVDDLDKYITFSPNKILISAEAEYLNSVADEIKKPFEDRLAIYFSAPFYLEIMAKGIDKANSLNILCQKLGISKDEVIAFGDGQNDMSMIKFAGLGVAMANAGDEVKEAADEITLSNNEDGIAHTLEKYF